MPITPVQRFPMGPEARIVNPRISQRVVDGGGDRNDSPNALKSKALNPKLVVVAGR